MNKSYYFPTILFLVPFLFASSIHTNELPFLGTSAQNDSPVIDNPVEIPTKPSQPIDPFTGKITKNKVRMRLQASLDAPILCELNKDDLLSVVAEIDEFYVILPPKETRAYVFRTFVLDNVVEGSRVNVRLEPALESPIIGQLNSGDKVEGSVSPLSSKWLEIAPPSSTRFYVCKEYVEKIGSPAMLEQLERRKVEVAALLNSAFLIAENELKKDYREIQLESAFSNLNTIIKQYSDFPEDVEKAKNLRAKTQESYLKKKIAYLEALAYSTEHSPKTTDTTQPEPLLLPVNPIPTFFPDEITQEELTLPTPKISIDWSSAFDTTSKNGKMTTWIPTEQALFETWLTQEKGTTPQEFYDEQFAEAATLKGILEPYSRTIRNKPGDFLLVSPSTNLPIAYLYSTRVNLQDNIGQEVTLHGFKRPNNNFAFPAYFIFSIE